MARECGRSQPVALFVRFLLTSVLLVGATTPRYEFELNFQHKPIPWHVCPPDWIKYSGKCYRVILDVATWEEAQLYCRSYGGYLAKIDGFNKNKDVGDIVRKAVNVHTAGTDEKAQYTWIGFYRAPNGSYLWADGQTSSEQQGFWKEGQPEPYNEDSNTSLCAYITIGESEYGDFRWSLQGCEKRRPFVCEVTPCVEGSVRCANGQGCYCTHCRCDRQKDCQDASDEWGCPDGVQCGADLSGSEGTFHSPNFPFNYSRYADCLWRIATPVGTKIQLQFVAFSVEAKYDHVTVYDGVDETARILGTFTGEDTPNVPLSSGNFLLVTFQSDHSTEYKGFNATWETETFVGSRDSCGGQLVATDTGDWFASPLYPRDYPESVVCDWIITAQNLRDIVTLQFTDFELESDSDWVEVWEGKSEDGGLYGRFTGFGLPKIIMSSGSSLFLRMKTDSMISHRGFNVSFFTGCNVRMNLDHVEISSPGYGITNYPDGLICSWYVSDPRHKPLTLIFRPPFSTEQDLDVLYVYNSSQLDPKIEFSGRVTPAAVRSQEGMFLLRFATDNHIRRAGWSASISYDCPVLKQLAHLQLNTSDRHYGSVVDYHCDEGYLLMEPSRKVCDMEGRWQPKEQPRCVEIDCGSPGVPEYSTIVSLDKTTYGGRAIYKCVHGYRMHGREEVKCAKSGWSRLPSCQVVTCPKAQAPKNGRVEAEENHYGAVTTYYCKANFRMVGMSQAYCTIGGRWSSKTPTCERNVCPSIQGVSNGSSNVTGPVQAGQAVAVQCEDGFQPDRDNILVCQSTGLYDKPAPACTDINECSSNRLNTCQPHTCVNIPGGYQCRCLSGYHHPSSQVKTECEDIKECDNTNGRCSQICINSPGSYTCSCHHGYILYQGGSAIRFNGQPLVPGKTCIALCTAFSVENGNAVVVGNSLPGRNGIYIYPTKAYIECHAGFVPDGPSLVHCLETGGWSADVNKCTESSCPIPDIPLNGEVSLESSGRKAVYSCDEGYVLDGPDQRFCQLLTDDVTGQQRHVWSGVKPQCQALDCGQIDDPVDGEVYMTGTTYLSVASFTCLCGYKLLGSSERICQASGTWSGRNTKCYARTCAVPVPPVFGSIMSPEEQGFPVGSYVEFECDSGYELSDSKPMQCVVDQYYRFSHTPDYVLSLSIEYQVTETMSQDCVDYYRDETIRNLQTYKVMIKTLCVNLGSPKVYVHQKSQASVIGNALNIEVSISLQHQAGQKVETACQCASIVEQDITLLENPYVFQIAHSTELDCPSRNLLRTGISALSSKWACPEGLVLRNADGLCGQSLPECSKECIFWSAARVPDEQPSTDVPLSTSSVFTTTSANDITSTGQTFTAIEISSMSSVTLKESTLLSSATMNDQTSTGSTPSSIIQKTSSLSFSSTYVTTDSTVSSSFTNKINSMSSMSSASSSMTEQTSTSPLTSTSVKEETIASSSASASIPEETSTFSVISSSMKEQTSISSTEPNSMTSGTSSSPVVSSPRTTQTSTSSSSFVQEDTSMSSTASSLNTLETSTSSPITAETMSSSMSTTNSDINWSSSAASTTTIQPSSFSLWSTTEMSTSSVPSTTALPIVSTELTTVPTTRSASAITSSASKQPVITSTAINPTTKATTTTPSSQTTPTPKPTTQTTPRVTTPKPTTSTTPRATTPKPTSPEPTTSATLSATTPKSTIQTTPKPTTIEPTTPKPTTPAPSKPTTTMPSKPATSKPTTAKPTTTKPTTRTTPKPTTPATPMPTTPTTQKTTTPATPMPTTPPTPKPSTPKPTDPSTPKHTIPTTPKPTSPKTRATTPKPTTASTPKPTTPTTPKLTPTTPTTPKPTTPTTPKPTTPPTPKPTTPPTPKPTTPKPTTPPMSKPTTQKTTTPKPTTPTMPEPTSPTTPKPTTQTTSKPTTPKPSTPTTPVPTTPTTLKLTTQSTPKPTIPSTPKPTIPTTSKPTTPTTPMPTTPKPTTPALSSATMPIPTVLVLEERKSVFVVEIHDFLDGDFSNSCINEVHNKVNTKINKLMNMFNAPAARHCAGTTDMEIILLDGTLSFTSSRASVTVVYGVDYSSSKRGAVESCGNNFATFSEETISSSLKAIRGEISTQTCRRLVHTGRNTTVIKKEWGCEKNWVLDFYNYICIPMPPEPVDDGPKMSLTFTGSFLAEDTIPNYCVPQYHAALVTELLRFEVGLRRKMASTMCSHIHISLSENLSLAPDLNQKMDSKALVKFYPLRQRLSKEVMEACLKEAVAVLLQPRESLSTLTLNRSKTFNCSSLTLSPEYLNTSLATVQFSCQNKYSYDDHNFRCISNVVPLYETDVDIHVSFGTDIDECENSLETEVHRAIQNSATVARNRLKNKVLCDTTSEILLQYTQGVPRRQNQNVVIFRARFGLLSLTGNQKSVLQCYTEFQTVMKDLLDRSLSLVPARLTDVCRSVKIGKMKAKKSTWTCQGNYVYDSDSRQCKTTQNKLSDPNRGNGRRKRSLVSSTMVTTRTGQDKPPYWNSSIPSCQASSLKCPVDVLLPVGTHHYSTYKLPLDNFTDVQGVVPSFTFNPPGNFLQDYVFIKSLNVTVTAAYGLGRSVKCVFRVVLVDDTPPTVACKTGVVREIYDTDDRVVQFWIQSQPVTAVDYSNIRLIEFNPPEGSFIRMKERKTISATVYDNAGNEASCSFVYEAVPSKCPAWSLSDPGGGGIKECSGPADGRDTTYSCKVSCPPGKDFVYPPPKGGFYKCGMEGIWDPDNIVPDCADKLGPAYSLNMAVEFDYRGATGSVCLDLLGQNAKKALERIAEQCKEVDKPTFSVNRIIPSPNKIKITATGYVTVSNLNTIGSNPAEICGRQILGDVKDIAFRVPGCGNPNQTSPCQCVGDTVTSLMKCTPGTYADRNSRCVSCPKGKYQDLAEQTSCKACPRGTSTENKNSVNKSQCLKRCEAGEFSPSGVVPCSKCHKGSYQNLPGYTHCIACGPSKSTEDIGAVRAEDCVALCQPGFWSCCSVGPCSHCPLNTYTNTSGSMFCHLCLPNTVTLDIGSNSITDCKEIDQCVRHKCQNGATCVNRHTFYTCDCPSGFTGQKCEVNQQSCASKPCFNGGTCQEIGDSHTCACPDGYHGNKCENKRDPCASQVCFNGYCVTDRDGAKCQCYDGFQGPSCNEDIDDCSPSSPCVHGTCIDMIAGYFCDCKDTGYQGEHCDMPINRCSSHSCINKGTCSPTSEGGIDCMCEPGFTGSLCEINTNECSIQPCENDAHCVDLVNDFECVCMPGYSNKTCNSHMNECDTKPCLNGGNCVKLDDDYQCNCPKGFEGLNCEQETNECQPYPCFPRGSVECIDRVGFFQCACKQFWTGEHCETQIHPCSGSNVCSNGATCVPATDASSCICPPNYTGTLCTVKISLCESSPCLNNGDCGDTEDNYTCNCSDGFEGVRCEDNINECDNDPCQNGGVCTDVINGFVCNCPPGFDGIRCERDLDDCVSRPCQNDGDCENLSNTTGYVCHCQLGFEGKFCEIEGNSCVPEPCENGGSCLDGQGVQECDCPVDFTGDYCEILINDCEINNPCLNGGTCVDGVMSASCDCTVPYGGEDCGKLKSDDYDLYFEGMNGSMCLLPEQYIGLNQTGLTLCTWVRFIHIGSQGTFLSLLEIIKQNEARDDEGRRVILSLTGSAVIISLFNDLPTLRLDLIVNDGLWHHLCFKWMLGTWNLWLDGRLARAGDSYGRNRLIPERLQILLGQRFESGPDDVLFRGVVSQVNVYSMYLNNTTIQSLAANCSLNRLPGNIFNWVLFRSYLHGDVANVVPALCGKTQCPPGIRGKLCNITIDKVIPEIVFCPADILVVNGDSRRSVVEWQEPVFKDNIAIVRQDQTHRSGQTFGYGEYLVSYVAYDAENNSAECQFEIVVKPHNCEEPAPPLNGLKACKAWPHGLYCTVGCLTDYKFVEVPPPFYRCGKEGFWDPPRGQPFMFPSCSMLHPPASSTLGGDVKFTGPQCTDELKTKLQETFVAILQQLDEKLGLCGSKACSYKDVTVQCDIPSSRRRRRQVNGVVYKVDFALNLTSAGNVLETQSKSFITEEIENSVKQGQFNSDSFTADLSSLQVSVEVKCLAGQTLTSVNNGNPVCLDCPKGYYLSASTSACELCARGYYSKEAKKSRCEQCPSKQTTSGLGSSSQDQCYVECAAGSYFNSTVDRCELCPLGEYQDIAGQTSCKSCPNGLTTAEKGSKVSGDCDDLCKLGQELAVNGECQPCPVGSYRDSVKIDFCEKCPYGKTTLETGATSLDLCNLVACLKGWWRTKENLCEICPKSTYQPQRDAVTCIPCGPGLTTPGQGETTEDHCIPGEVDECKLGIAKCDGNATCTDTEESYNCTCNQGYHGDGTYCKDECVEFCGSHGECRKQPGGEKICICDDDYQGLQCRERRFQINTVLSAAGAGLAFVIILLIAGYCFIRTRKRQKQHVDDRIYRDRPPPVAFQNSAYESYNRSPSSLLRLESSSNSSDAQPWKKSVFISHEETQREQDDFDGDWDEPLEFRLEDFDRDQTTPTPSFDIDYF